MINNKKDKFKALFAGIFSQWVLSAASIIIYILMNRVFHQDMVFLLAFSIINLMISIYNLIPFIKLDGYWIISLFLNMQNLYQKSLLYLFSKLRFIKKEYESEERVNVLLCYGIVASIFYVLLWGTIITSIYEVLRVYVGDSVSIIAVIVMIGVIIYQLFGKLIYYRRTNNLTRAD